MHYHNLQLTKFYFLQPREMYDTNAQPSLANSIYCLEWLEEKISSKYTSTFDNLDVHLHCLTVGSRG